MKANQERELNETQLFQLFGGEGGKKCKLFGKFCSDVLNECSLY